MFYIRKKGGLNLNLLAIYTLYQRKNDTIQQPFLLGNTERSIRFLFFHYKSQVSIRKRERCNFDKNALKILCSFQYRKKEFNETLKFAMKLSSHLRCHRF